MNKKDRQRRVEKLICSKSPKRVYTFYLTINDAYMSMRGYGDALAKVLTTYGVVGSSPTQDGLMWCFLFETKEESEKCAEVLKARFHVNPRFLEREGMCSVLMNGVLVTDYPLNNLN